MKLLTWSGCAALGLLFLSCEPPVPYRGVNLAGAEFRPEAMPGTHGTDYMYPSPSGADYFVSKRMNVFRLPFRWERLQRPRRTAFIAAELGRLTTTVNGLTSKGVRVILDPHNYARYDSQVIGAGVPNADFADLWSRLATLFKDDSRVIFGLMNEPHGMPTEQWASAANEAIRAIRATGATNLVLVPGNAWTGAHSWAQSWYGTPNATAMLAISDPGNNMAFEVHQYLDGDSSGVSATCVSGTIGSQRLQGFTSWLKQHRKRGFLGEFGAGTDATCQAALRDMLGHIHANSDVWLGWTYWAAGPWWGDYFMSLEPRSGQDRPQLSALTPYL